MYRLAALPFLELGMSVAIAGYRTYPDAEVTGQVADLGEALNDLSRRKPDLFRTNVGDEENLGTCIVAHSSGAHIALLLIVEQIRKHLESVSISINHDRFPVGISPSFDTFIGLSGPYAISHHFDFEASRGVEELSPMKPVCGYSREEFKTNSPAIRLARLLRAFPESEASCIDKFIPQLLLVHGMEDSTVPFTATSEAASILRSCGVQKCDELYIGKTGHQETVMHLMLGGKTKDGVVKWLKERQSRHGEQNTLALIVESRM